MRIILVRHGMTAGNMQKKYIGTTDEPLCLEGIEALRGVKISGCDKWYVSPLKRCVETARLIGADEITLAQDLRECDFGAFENKNYMELSGNADYQAWIDSGGTMAFPGGESREAFSNRCCDAFEYCIEDALAKGYKQIGFCVHGGTIMSIMERFAVRSDGTGYSYYDWHVGNGAFIELETDDKWVSERKIIKDDRIS